MARDIRQKALQKIAALSASSSTTSFDRSDLDKLCRAVPGYGQTREATNGYDPSHSTGVGKVPMAIREFEVLLALCKAAPIVKTPQSAQKLARQLGPYLLESHSQIFAASPFYRKVQPSPTEALAYNVTAALLSLGMRHDDVQQMASDNFRAFINACAHASEAVVPPGDDGGPEAVDNAIRVATITISLLGFLDAAAAQASFWRVGGRLALVQRLRDLMSDDFFVAVETAFSTIRNCESPERHIKEWKRHLHHYDHIGRPLSAMLLQQSFMWLIVASTSVLVADVDALRTTHVLDILMSGDGLLRPLTAKSGDADFRSVELYANAVIDQMNHLESSADFVRLRSPAEQEIAYNIKASALTSFLNCSRLNEDAADADILMNWLEDTVSDPVSMANDNLATTVLKATALLCKVTPPYAVTVSRLLPRFIVQAGAKSETVAVAADCLVFVLRLLSTDAVISTLYTLGNVLSSEDDQSDANGLNGNAADRPETRMYAGRQSTGSSISLQITSEEETAAIRGGVVQAICRVASASKDEKITALAQSMLLQKYGKINGLLDAHIIRGAAVLAFDGAQFEFRSLLKFYSRIAHLAIVENKEAILEAVRAARNHISADISRESPLWDIYWEHLLDSIISKGDVPADQHNHPKESEVELAAREIAQLLQPLAVLMSTHDLDFDEDTDDETHAMLRDAWFNIVVHGFVPNTARGKAYLAELCIIAIHSPALVLQDRGEEDESDIELNTILRRGMSSDRESLLKKQLVELMPSKESEIRALSYRKLTFLQSAYVVEILRAEAGDCTRVVTYFLEPSMRKPEVSRTMEGIMNAVMDKFLDRTLGAVYPAFSAQYAAGQLARILCNCCHRIERVQQAAFACADRLIRDLPSALCQRSSLFALLELLSLMWTSCLEAETDLYEPRTIFKSSRCHLEIQLSDDYAFRRHTLDNLNRKARVWLTNAVALAPSDVKGLLQTYLSEYDDDGAYGHISLGRSFAVEMSSVIPVTDQKLSSIDNVGDCNINTASDFIAQYTTRQEYRYTEALPDRSLEWLSFMRVERRSSLLPSSDESADAVTALAHIEKRIVAKKTTPLSDVRDILRRAAALLCRSDGDECNIVHYLVSIPFAMFTKQSMILGVSLWLGVMHENPRMEPRLLMEIAQQWEFSMQRKLGLFNPSITDRDPFFLREEFAPTDNEAMVKRRQHVYNMLAPHSRLLQFFASHYNAARLGNADTQKTFLRLLNATLDRLTTATTHPMAREIRFRIVLFGLKVLKTSTTMAAVSQMRFKDKILSAALSWFSAPPRWSFGSNMLQLKTEIRLLSDVMVALKATSTVGANAAPGIKSLQPKEQLLLLLLESEQAKLLVWVYPLAEPARSQFAVGHANKLAIESALAPLVRTAWAESPSLAIELVSRFQYARIHKEVRWLLLNFPAKAVSEPEALPILLGGSLPDDVSLQLNHLLYWAPVNPITAVSFFLPQYRNHPFVLQYVLRALESHSVDVTFFYVPQIVQTLRYDPLGYAERYIIETAQFSQLFAHQIIWNMKANMYKDDNGEIPSDIKPTLDHVMNRIIESFSATDRVFYEREFSFFDEVTGISGKLKPFIKKSKPEKKQKIEEELRKIKVEVGVYLPSNPDGVVIGIDRKSGKPLQSHAKAPYMATFRIKKPKGGSVDDFNEMLEETIEDGYEGEVERKENTVEVWQSAIFKVGDDCRQDVLALQMIAAFRGIFHHVGLDVYVYPNRVTATAPGCGVIDVLPNSISRDMLGREAVNGLYEYFISKYGNEDSLRFQQARNNFVKSMAAYSVISFLLQFKDRHNGNIMIDDAGHILHIDFGFCFDIAPGGIKFERAPFKLTSEMVAVMGGSTDHQSFKWFEELCVKAFLASRQYTEKLSQIVLLMMDSGLPCFKPESVKHFKERMVLEKSEREAADFMKDLIKKSYTSYSTGVYDHFQLLTNGIPY